MHLPKVAISCKLVAAVIQPAQLLLLLLEAMRSWLPKTVL
jgi:hypothetical protein